jgi:hypothetical protein
MQTPVILCQAPTGADSKHPGFGWGRILKPFRHNSGRAGACHEQPTLRLPLLCTAFLTILAAAGTADAACVKFTEAPKHLGQDQCVTGKVVAVNQGDSGTFFVNFCEDYRACPFTVVVFRDDLEDVGDVRALQGKTMEIHGRIQEYEGRPEIILKNIRQLRGEAAKIPPIPKNFDVQRRGSFSAGNIRSRRSGSSRTSSRRTAPRRNPREEQASSAEP